MRTARNKALIHFLKIHHNSGYEYSKHQGLPPETLHFIHHKRLQEDISMDIREDQKEDEKGLNLKQVLLLFAGVSSISVMKKVQARPMPEKQML